MVIARLAPTAALCSRPSGKDIQDFSLQQVSLGRGNVLKVDTPPAVVHSAGHHACEKKLSLTGGLSLVMVPLNEEQLSSLIMPLSRFADPSAYRITPPRPFFKARFPHSTKSSNAANRCVEAVSSRAFRNRIGSLMRPLHR